MAVEVTTHRTRGGALIKEKHEKANNIAVHDGHLFVLRHQDSVAVYRPEDWRNAVVLEEQPA